MVAALNALDPMAYTYASIANMFVCFRADFVTLANCWEDSKAEPWFGPLPVEVRACCHAIACDVQCAVISQRQAGCALSGCHAQARDTFVCCVVAFSSHWTRLWRPSAVLPSS